jgi:hypothetical protein
VGVGLLDALGHYDMVRLRVQSGCLPHPTTDQRVIDALLSGHRNPVRRSDGSRELKVNFFPHQLTDWLGLQLVTSGSPVGFLFPSVGPEYVPAVLDRDRPIGQDDIMDDSNDDNYPNILAMENDFQSRQPTVNRPTWLPLLRKIQGIPRLHVTLGHQMNSNSDFLGKIFEDL